MGRCPLETNSRESSHCGKRVVKPKDRIQHTGNASGVFFGLKPGAISAAMPATMKPEPRHELSLAFRPL